MPGALAKMAAVTIANGVTSEVSVGKIGLQILAPGNLSNSSIGLSAIYLYPEAGESDGRGKEEGTVLGFSISQ